MPTINAEIKQRLVKAMEARRKKIMQYLLELKAEGFTKHTYTCPFIRWEDCERYLGSCWGSEIADLAAFVCKEGVFCLRKDGNPVAIDDAELSQNIKRAQVLAQAGTAVHKTIESNTGMRGLSEPKHAQVVKTNEGLLVFDYSAKGSINAFNEPVDAWVPEGAARGLKMTDEMRAACDKAIETGVAQPVEVEPSRSAWCIPDKAAGKVALFGFIESQPGQAVQAVKKKTLTLRNHDEASADEVAEVSDELLKTYKAMAGRKHETSLFAGPNGETCVVLPELRDGALQFLCLNLGGKGKHVAAEYAEGFELPVFAIRSENMNETVVKVPLHRFKVVMATPEGKDPKMIMLYDMLKAAGAYGNHAGLDKGVDLALDKDKEEWFTLRFQAYVCPGGEDIELFERLYSYQSTDDRPTTLVTYHTGSGTSFYTPTSAPLKVQPSVLDPKTGQLSAFNLSVAASDKKAGDMATYTAEQNRKNLSEGFAMATPIGLPGFPYLANATLMCQWPVHAPVPQRAASAFSGDGWGGDEEDEPAYLTRGLGACGDGGPVYRSLGSSAMPEGELMASKTGFGSYQGKSNGVAVGDLTRRNSAGTGTFCLIFSVQPKPDSTRSDLVPGEFNVAKNDVRDVVRMLDNLHEIAGNAVRIFDDDAEVCVDAPKKKEKASGNAPAAGAREPPTKKPRSNVGVIAAPALVEVAM